MQLLVDQAKGDRTMPRALRSCSRHRRHRMTTAKRSSATPATTTNARGPGSTGGADRARSRAELPSDPCCRLGSVGSDDKTKGVEEALRLRATAMAQRLKSAAARGGPLLDQLSARIHGKLKDVPEQRLQHPPATIEAPTALHYMLLGDSEEVADLREMFENLLVSSMDNETVANAHPAFVPIISQMSPDEARILKSIDRNTYQYFDLGKSRGLQTLLGSGIGINEGKIDFYISNLARLGIIQLHTGASGDYNDASPELIRLIDLRFPIRDVDLYFGLQPLLVMHVTPLGQQFLDTCVRPRAR